MRPLPRYLALCMIGTLVTGVPAQEMHEWPLYRGNAGFTGVTLDDSIKPPLKLVWSYRLDGDASSDAGAGVTVAGKKVFVNVSNTYSIIALNADTGRWEWEYKETRVGYMNVPSYHDGRLFLWQREQGKAFAVLTLDASTGKTLWQQTMVKEKSDTHRVGLPVAGGKVFCSEGGDEPAVVAFDEKTGREVWRSKLGADDGDCALGPTSAAGKVFVGVSSSFGFRNATKGAVLALDAESGKVLWRNNKVIPHRTVVSDGKIVACSEFTKIAQGYVLDANTGELLWTSKGHHYNPATLTKDLLLYRPYGASCFGLDRTSGKERWSFQEPKVTSGCCSPAVSGQYAYFGTGVISPGDLESLAAFQHEYAPREKGISGTMHAVDLKTGKSVWRFSTANCICGDPALAYGRLYFMSRDGCVYCFAPAKEGEPTTPDAKDRTPPAAPGDVEALLGPKHADQPRPGKDWPMRGGTPAGGGLNNGALKLPLALAWKVDTGGRIVGAAAIRDGKAFVGSDAGKIVAVDLSTGKKTWEVSTGAQVRCSPATALDLVYCGSDSGLFLALDASTGKKRWSFEAGGPIQSSPIVIKGIVLFGANDHHVYALDRYTGKKLWSFRVNDYAIQASPVVQGDTVYVGQWTDWVWALDLKSGKLRWRSYIPVTVEALAYHRDKLYVRNPNYVVELDPSTGKRLRIGTASWGWGGLAFLNDKMFLSGIQSQYGTSGGTATNLDDPGGEPRQIKTLEEVRYFKPQGLKGWPELASMGTPLVIGDKLCFAGVNGKLQIVEPDGTRRWHFQMAGTCHATPVAADGVLLVGCDDGHLYAFKEGGK